MIEGYDPVDRKGFDLLLLFSFNALKNRRGKKLTS
jgi:hypothetical protein